MIKKIHCKLGYFFDNHKDIGFFVGVFSFLAIVLLIGCALIYGFLLFEYKPEPFLFLFLIKLWPLHISVILVPVFLYLMDRSLSGAVQ